MQFKTSAQKEADLLGDHNKSPMTTYQQVRWTQSDDTDRVPKGLDGFRTYCTGVSLDSHKNGGFYLAYTHSTASWLGYEEEAPKGGA